MPTTDETDEQLRAARTVLLQMSEWLSPLHEFVAGQRQQFESEGFSPTAAEVMAMALWPILLAAATAKPDGQGH